MCCLVASGLLPSVKNFYFDKNKTIVIKRNLAKQSFIKSIKFWLMCSSFTCFWSARPRSKVGLLKYPLILDALSSCIYPLSVLTGWMGTVAHFLSRCPRLRLKEHCGAFPGRSLVSNSSLWLLGKGLKQWASVLPAETVNLRPKAIYEEMTNVPRCHNRELK